MARNKFHICKEYHIQFSEIDRMMFFEYEWLLEDIKAYQKKEEEEKKKQDSNYNSKFSGYKAPPMPKAPPLPKVSIPKF